MNPAQIESIFSLSSPTAHPDGTLVVAVKRPSLDSNTYVSELVSVSASGLSNPLLIKVRHASAPAFSPDGRHLAFLIDADTDAARLAVTAWPGDTVSILTPQDAVSEFVWGPDSRSLAYTAKSSAGHRLSAEPEVPGSPRIIGRLHFVHDEAGYLGDTSTSVHVVGLDPAAGSRRLTSVGASDANLSWSPNGKWIAFTSHRQPSSEGESLRDVFVAASDGSSVRALTFGGWRAESTAFSGDSATVFFHGPQVAADGFAWTSPCSLVAKVEVEAPGVVTTITSPAELELAVGFMPQPTMLITSMDRVHVISASKGSFVAASFKYDGSDVAIASLPDSDLTEIVATGSQVVGIFRTPTSPGELGIIGDGEVTLRSDFSSDLEIGVIAPPIPIVATAADGYPVSGTLFLPVGDGPHPLVLNVHGGPYYFDSAAFTETRHAYTSAGYAYLISNIRGSMGYGLEHYGAGIAGATGTERPPAIQDLLAVVDAAVSEPSVANDRVGVIGLSFGGMVSALLATTSDRFTGAISENGLAMARVLNLSSDVGWLAHEAFTGRSNPYEGTVLDVDLTVVAPEYPTPLLVMQHEGDLRVPLEQGASLYRSLRAFDHPVVLARFEGGQHLVADVGEPRGRYWRLSSMLSWWATLMPTETNVLEDDNPFRAAERELAADHRPSDASAKASR